VSKRRAIREKAIRKDVKGNYRALFHSITCLELLWKMTAKNVSEQPVITAKLKLKMSETQGNIPPQSA
jgi:hypothetical protein